MPRKPNFIIILTDDQGYGDLSCMGAPDLKTPHLDALAASGVRFTDWYANAPVCSPTRASLMTGRYPGNAGVRSILKAHRTASGLPPEATTIATAVKPLGYRTAMFGKWHLGLAPGCRPNDHGFDTFFGHLGGCIDFFSHIFMWDKSIDPLHDLWENDREVYRNGQYMTEMIGQHSVEAIRQFARDDQPFLLYVSFNAPHYPMHAPPEYVDRFKGMPPDRRIMAAMLAAVDDQVGAIVAELEKQGLREDTFISFQSDNGPSRETRNWLDGTTDLYYGGSTGGFRGEKFSLFEGGIRVPGIISYPRKIPPKIPPKIPRNVSAGQTSPLPGASMDIFPTVLAEAGGDLSGHEFDGVDLMPCLAGDAPPPQRDLCFEQGGQTAIRRGDWKLVLHGQLKEGKPPDSDVWLSNLAEDPGEQVNRRDDEPGWCAELKTAAERWRAGIEERWQRQWQPQTNGTTSRA